MSKKVRLIKNASPYGGLETLNHATVFIVREEINGYYCLLGEDLTKAGGECFRSSETYAFDPSECEIVEKDHE